MRHLTQLPQTLRAVALGTIGWAMARVIPTRSPLRSHFDLLYLDQRASAAKKHPSSSALVDPPIHRRATCAGAISPTTLPRGDDTKPNSEIRAI
ncbi:hypothetical protein B0J13DRAFT_577588 [Dactylonectria estremocensis]|uniref:Uncharacterized protein n=1 Tax=Dactylonectria estremocensis TaxID=1079267 RepID=A0A9P9I8Q7_9HYPO|nr:hypothetical protein B0J13DRAFT_577588 [Dactylonectria estremocensis]